MKDKRKKTNKTLKNKSRGKKNESKTSPKLFKKNLSRIWWAIGLSLLSWVPLVNIFFALPWAMYLLVRQIMLCRQEPDKYGGLWFAVIVLLFMIVLFILGVIGFIHFRNLK
jgi:heme A synthase